MVSAKIYLLNIEILVFFQLNIYKGGRMSTTIHQTKSYLYLPDTNKIIQVLKVLLLRLIMGGGSFKGNIGVAPNVFQRCKNVLIRNLGFNSYIIVNN